MPGSKVVGTRVDSSVAEKLEEIARKKRKKVSELIKEVLESYVESPPQEEDNISDPLREILRQFEERALEYINRLKEFCKEHSEIVARNNPNVNQRFIYESCLYDLRRHAYNTLRDAFTNKVIPLISDYIINIETRLQVEKKAHEIINKAVKELYPYPYPPVRPV